MKSSLEEDFDVMEITLDQMEKHFCGNILQVNDSNGHPLIVMSQSAYAGFTSEKIKHLETYGTVLPMTLTIIESIGGAVPGV